MTKVSDGLKDVGFHAGIWALALFATFLNLLNHHHYPLLRPEVGLVALMLFAMALLVGGAQHRYRKASFILTGVCLAIIVDLNTNIEKYMFFALWGAVTVAAFFADRVILKLLGAAAASVAIFQVLAAGTGALPFGKAHALEAPAAQAAIASKRPPIVHILLDSYLGTEGMQADPAVYGELAREHTAFFTGHGFQLFDQAYSRHQKTVNSLPYAFSYGTAPLASQSMIVNYMVPEKLTYFTDLSTHGYRSYAILPDYIDLCVKQPLTSCENYKRSDLSSMIGTEMPVTDRAKTLAFTLVRLSRLTQNVALKIQANLNGLAGMEGRHPANRAKLSTLVSAEALDHFGDDLRSIDYGELRFAHILLPHDPYVFTADCRIKPEAEWRDELGPSSVAAREVAYREQLRCTLKMLDRMLAKLQSTEAGRAAIVVIHGDHGSRIVHDAIFTDLDKVSHRDLAMTYSTLFAIRVPGEPAGVVQGHVALDELLQDFAAREFASAPRPAVKAPEIIANDPEWIPRVREKLPGFAAVD